VRVNILQALDDPALYGAHPAFSRDPASWRPWRAFLAACYGLPLDAEGRELFERCTGLEYDPPADGWSEVVLVVGRQAGKTKIGSLIVHFEAAFGERSQDGDLYALLVAQDARASPAAGTFDVTVLLGHSENPA